MKALLRYLAVLTFGWLLVAQVNGDDRKPDPTPAKASASPLDKPAPENIEDLKAIQSRVKEVLKKVLPATVGVVVGRASGSGVIIDKEGHVLTAGHVSGAPDQEVILILQDGKRIKGKSLGSKRNIDSGLIKITEKGDFPFVELGKSAGLKQGQWVISTGHPGGFKPGRSSPVRLGRVLDANPSLIRTDCTLVGGDSGGPLFDLDGKVIGIHSRIGGRIVDNIHVPADTYRETWARLVKGEVWGGPAYLGVEVDTDAKSCKVAKVSEKSAAEKAGIKTDDIILKLDGTDLTTPEDLRKALGKKENGDTITLTVQRGKETLEVKVKLGGRGGREFR